MLGSELVIEWLGDGGLLVASGLRQRPADWRGRARISGVGEALRFARHTERVALTRIEELVAQQVSRQCVGRVAHLQRHCIQRLFHQRIGNTAMNK